ncbi:hypothetical protein, partial [Paraburkholderia hospita]|uniref:hypothetical protein n=1 Tax=Paraburkholderia hospita TaxID=169430 RepID=UPI001A999635
VNAPNKIVDAIQVRLGQIGSAQYCIGNGRNGTLESLATAVSGFDDRQKTFPARSRCNVADAMVAASENKIKS